MTAYKDWRAYDQKVDNSGLDTGTASGGEGRYVSGAYTLLAAGPPRLSALTGGSSAAVAGNTGGANWALPIGMIQNFNLGHQRTFSRFWELGSDRSYFVSGRTVAQAGFSRVMYHGPSILRALYAWYYDTVASVNAATVFPSLGISGFTNPVHDIQISPGYENLFLNLASDLFSQPCGLLVYMVDSNQNQIGQVYLEETYVPSHSIATDAQGVVVQEQVSLQPERVMPVALTNVVKLSNFIEGQMKDAFEKTSSLSTKLPNTGILP